MTTTRPRRSRSRPDDHRLPRRRASPRLTTRWPRCSAAAGAGGFDFGALHASRPARCRQQLMAAQEQAAETVVEGVAGGGAVRIAVTGGSSSSRSPSRPRRSTPTTSRCSRTWCSPRSTTPADEIQGLQPGRARPRRPRPRRPARAGACSTPVATYAGPVQDLIDELGRLPGVGPKSAQRIAFHLLKLPRRTPSGWPASSSRPRTGWPGASAASTCPRASCAASAPTTGATRTRDLRGRGAPRPRRRREDRRVPRPLPRAARAPSARSRASAPISCG